MKPEPPRFTTIPGGDNLSNEAWANWAASSIKTLTADLAGRDKAIAEKPFPVHPEYRGKDGDPDSVKWSELSEAHAQRIHGQTLKRLAERGGLSPHEIVLNVEGLPWAAGVTDKHALEVMNRIKYRITLPTTEDKP